MGQAHRDPVFEEVARREALAQRQVEIDAQRVQRQAEWKASPEYQRLRRIKVRRLLGKAMRGGFR